VFVLDPAGSVPSLPGVCVGKGTSSRDVALSLRGVCVGEGTGGHDVALSLQGVVLSKNMKRSIVWRARVFACNFEESKSSHSRG